MTSEGSRESLHSAENVEETIGAASARYEQEEENRISLELQDGDLDHDDPDPLPTNASKKMKEDYLKLVGEYSLRVLEAFEICPGFKEESLWFEFTRTFRPETILHMPTELIVRWSHLLRNRGVQLFEKRGLSRKRALIKLLEVDSYPGPASDGEGDVDFVEELHPQQAVDEIPTKPTAESSTVPFKGNKENSVKIDAFQRIDPAQSQKRIPQTTPAITPIAPSPTLVSNENPSRDSSRRIDSITKAYSSLVKYSGDFTESLESHIERYETFCRVYKLDEAEKVRAFPIMLAGAAFMHYSHYYSMKAISYTELVNAFRAWYTSEEQKYRLLRIWQRPSLENAMKNSPEKSELEVFRKVSEDLVQTQHQLHEDYRKDRFLRDQLLVCADIPRLKRSLIEKIPATAQEAMQRIATLLSSEPRSAGAYFNQNDAEDAFYGFGKRYGGDARRRAKAFRHKGSTLKKKLATVKGCWVCGRSHRARGYHSPQDIIQAVNRIKNQKPTRTFTAEEVNTIQEAYAALIDDDGGGSDESGNSGDSSEGNEEVNFVQDFQQIERDNYQNLSNAAFSHGRSFTALGERHCKNTNLALFTGDDTIFRGIILDTGANYTSIMSIKQYQAYCREFCCPIEIDYSKNRNVKGIGGKSQAVGTAIIPIPFHSLGVIIDVEFRIMAEDCPSLLSMKDMLASGMNILIPKQEISIGERKQKLSFENGLLTYHWSLSDFPTALYTESELRKLHVNFGHPSTAALHRLLRTANPEECRVHVRRILERIVQECKSCQTHAPSTRRFKLSVGTGPLRFNHTIAIDVMYIEGRPVLHVVDEATHYAAAIFLKKVTSEHTWKALLKCWSRVYIGAPDCIRVDQGSNFVSRHFLDCARTEDIEVIQAPVESPATMTHVERYHAPLRAAYNKIRDDLPRSETDEECLQLAVKCVNDTVGPEGLCPTLLVYGTIPRPPRRTPAATQVQRSEAVERGLVAVKKEMAKRKVAFALRHPRSAEAQRQEDKLRLLPAGSPVRIYRSKAKKWEGPYPMINVDEGVVTVQMPRGRRIFRSSAVKPAASGTPVLHQLPRDDEDVSTQSVDTPDTTTPSTSSNYFVSTNTACTVQNNEGNIRSVKPDAHQPSHHSETNNDSSVKDEAQSNSDLIDKTQPHSQSSLSLNYDSQLANLIINMENSEDIVYGVFESTANVSDEDYISDSESADTVPDVFAILDQAARTPNPDTFHESRLKEIRGLFARGTFRIVKSSEVPTSSRIYGTRWVDVMKDVDGAEVPKSRLVAQAYADEGAATLCTKSPTVSRAGQRIVLATAAQEKDTILYTRDITQAYLQSHSSLERCIYLKPPLELNLSDEFVLRAIKPLYGLPESGLHWFLTYQGHHLNRLRMSKTRMDPCLLYLRNGNRLSGVTALQVDDNLGHGTEDFLQAEEENSRIFESKPRSLVTAAKSAIFNGVNISVMENNCYAIDQRVKLLEIKEPNTTQELISTRAKLQYIASCVRPDLAAPVQMLAGETITPTEETFKKMRSIIRWAHDTAEVQLKYVPLDMDSLRLLLFTDASFSKAEGKKSQMGFVVVLADKRNKANIIHWGSSVCHRVAHSVMAAELLALTYGFDQAFNKGYTVKREKFSKKRAVDFFIFDKFRRVSAHSPKFLFEVMSGPIVCPMQQWVTLMGCCMY